MSRARDRLPDRSVREKELNQTISRRMYPTLARADERSCSPKRRPCRAIDSDFEREILGRLLERDYRVTPQVGAMGYRIDMVVEGRGDKRLAIECDGDMYHGPERWADDMTRQRVLERVGWRFWRCWSSSFTIDPDGCMAELFDLLDKLGIHPVVSQTREEAHTEHRTATTKPDIKAESTRPNKGDARSGIEVGDRVIVRYLDDNKIMSFVLSNDRDDPVNGFVSASSPLGSQLFGSNEEDEVEFVANGVARWVLVVRTQREQVAAE